MRFLKYFLKKVQRHSQQTSQSWDQKKGRLSPTLHFKINYTTNNTAAKINFFIALLFFK